MKRRRCIVSGRVQGVWYRATTCDKAMSLGLSGVVRNLPGGRVEVVVSGPDGEVDVLCRWLWQGPPMAQVDEVKCEDYQGPVAAGFSVG